MTDLWLAGVLSSLICGFVGYVFAIRTGRNPLLWTSLGVVLNAFGLWIYSRKSARSRMAN
jgi:hypothetical protein